jgi:hypothetical protein
MARILEIDLEEYIPAERMREWPDETFEWVLGYIAGILVAL